MGTAAEKAWAPTQRPGRGKCKRPPCRLKSTHVCQWDGGLAPKQSRRGMVLPVQRADVTRRCCAPLLSQNAAPAATMVSALQPPQVALGTTNHTVGDFNSICRPKQSRPNMLSCLGSRRAACNRDLERLPGGPGAKTLCSQGRDPTCHGALIPWATTTKPAL